MGACCKRMEHRIQIIPKEQRKKFITKYHEHIQWIDNNFGEGIAKDGFISILDFLEQKNSHSIYVQSY